jgi:hypothetical protein
MSSRTPDDLPARIVVEVSEAAGEVIDEKLDEHIQEYHLPEPRSHPLRAAMFANRSIPDVECSRMGEVMEEEGLSVDELARRFGYPLTLVKREMADYLEAQDRWILRRAKLALG